MTVDFQRWTAKRKAEIVMKLVKGELNLVVLCREQDLQQSEVEGWISTFLQSGERGMKANPRDEAAQHEREVKDLRAKVGELVLELDARKKCRLWTTKPGEAFSHPERHEGRRQGLIAGKAVSLVWRAQGELLLPDRGRGNQDQQDAVRAD